MHFLFSSMLLFILLTVTVSGGLLSTLTNCAGGKCWKPQVPKIQPRPPIVKAFLPPIPTSTTQRPSKSPTHPPIPKPFESECKDIIAVFPLSPEINQSQIIERCRSRFDSLHSMHKLHQKLITTQPDNIHGDESITRNPNSHLIVLDLDETIMDQRTFGVSQYVYKHSKPSYWQSMNAVELMVNINQFEDRRQVHVRKSKTVHLWSNHRASPKIWIGIFRRDFMQFLEWTQTHAQMTFDIMLYSAAISDLLIYHAVTMELYYNYVHAINKQLTGDFEFKYAIARPDDIRLTEGKQKSLEALMNILGNNGGLISSYKNIVIVDDMAYDVWSSRVPQAMMDAEMNVMCFVPSPFSFDVGRRSKMTLDARVFRKIQSLMLDDFTFVDMIAIIGNLSLIQKQRTDSLEWESIESSGQMERL